MHKQLLFFVVLFICHSCSPKSNDKSKELLGENISQDQSKMGSKLENNQLENSNLNTIPKFLNSFVPEGYMILDTTNGDLNKDKYLDLILILKKIDEDSMTESTGKRPLLILLGQENGLYKLFNKSDNVVYCYNCGGTLGDPYIETVIKNGYFSIEHYGGSSVSRWERIITFKFSPQDNDWFLYKDGGGSLKKNPSNDPDAEVFLKEKEEVKSKKDFGRISFNQFDIYKE